ncbi:FRG domain-containing protein [Rheinheimera sp.]|uniref:FRG domain-containing protein n=1 Tax=Rheinheimera sp. TaxID=1869214 RepID=UPI0027367B8E|nr:FRG domain-containing protein [Rheinheimera sp.]MDP2716290.1 FRG domain-containing protein [Rheinheimera sp.]
MELKGQWIGRIHDGTNDGLVTLNIDSDTPNSGVILVFDIDTDKASTISDVKLELEGQTVKGQMSNFTFHAHAWHTADDCAPFQNSIPASAQLIGTIDDNLEIVGDWTSDIGTKGRFILTYREPQKTFEVSQDSIVSWKEFRERALSDEMLSGNLIFRGQKSSDFDLTTHFHRLGRRNMRRFFNDLIYLQHVVAATQNRKLDLNNPEEFTELMFLGQHHGFPTPLLDWSFSPFVAAFFAFKDIEKNTKTEGYARVFVFDREGWKLTGPHAADSVLDPRPALRILEVLSRDNLRATPQQSIVMFSNMANIENCIQYFEGQSDRKVIRYFDIPYSERNTVMTELRHMGITHSSMFPGLDGACQALREKLFK